MAEGDDRSRMHDDRADAWVWSILHLAGANQGDWGMVYGFTDCKFAKVHSLEGIPMFTAGKLNGKLKTGLHIDGKGRPATVSGCTSQRLMGVPTSSWGQQSMEATHEISEIFA